MPFYKGRNILLAIVNKSHSVSTHVRNNKYEKMYVQMQKEVIVAFQILLSTSQPNCSCSSAVLNILDKTYD